MEIELSPDFERNFRRRANKKVRKLYRSRVALLRKNPYDPSLNVHPLKYDLEGYFSFSLTDDQGTDDYRVLFQRLKGGRYYFADFGTHDQLYRTWR